MAASESHVACATATRYEMHLIGDPEGASKLVKLEQKQDVIRKVVLAVLGR